MSHLYIGKDKKELCGGTVFRGISMHLLGRSEENIKTCRLLVLMLNLKLVPPKYKSGMLRFMQKALAVCHVDL
jgi:hypothetical protein